MHEKVQKLLDALDGGNASLQLLKECRLYDPTIRNLDDTTPDDFSNLRNGEYRIICYKDDFQRPEFLFIQRIRINGKFDLRIQDLSRSSIFRQLDVLVRSTDAYCKEKETKREEQFFRPRYLHIDPTRVESIFKELFGSAFHETFQQQFHRPPFGGFTFGGIPIENLSMDTKTPKQKLMDAKAEVLKVIDPSCDPAKVTFYEMLQKRKTWHAQNSYDRGGDQEKVKKLNEAWGAFKEEIEKIYKDREINKALMQELDKKYPSIKKTL